MNVGGKNYICYLTSRSSPSPPPPSPLPSPPPPSLTPPLPPFPQPTPSPLHHSHLSRGELILDPKMCKEVFHNDQTVLSLEENCLIFATFDLSQNRLFVVLQHNGR